MSDILSRFMTPLFWVALVGVIADDLLPLLSEGGKVDVVSILKIVLMAFLGALRAQPAIMQPPSPPAADK